MLHGQISCLALQQGMACAEEQWESTTFILSWGGQRTCDRHLKASCPNSCLNLQIASVPLGQTALLIHFNICDTMTQCSHNGHEDPCLTVPNLHVIMALTRFLAASCATNSKSVSKRIAPDFIPFASVVSTGFASKPWLHLQTLASL